MLLAAAAGICYANSFGGLYFLDDGPVIFENDSISRIPWVEWLASFRGLVDLSFSLNYAVGGFNPVGYHLVNLAIHLAAGGTLYGIVRRTLANSRVASRYGQVAVPLATAIALLWLVHPLQTQAVTYVCQRYESAAALFYLLALYCFQRGVASDKRIAWWLGVVACFALGLRCKETVVTLPLVLLWYDRAFIAESWREVLSRKYLYLAMLVVGGLMSGSQILGYAQLLGQQVVSGPSAAVEARPVVTVPGLSPKQYFLSQAGVIVHYLRLSIVPTNQCLDYGWPIAETAAEIVPPLLALCALAIATLWCVWRRPACGFPGGAFFLVLAPSSSFIPIRDLAVEHRMYLPLAAVLLALVILGYDALQICARLPGVSAAGVKWIQRAGPLTVGVAAIVFGAETVLRNQLYRSHVAMWENVCVHSPGFWRGHINLAKALRQNGDIDGALRELTMTIALEPSISDAWLTRGSILARRGQTEQALRDYDQAIQADDRCYKAYFNRGILLQDRGELRQALADFDQAIEIKPDYSKALVARGELFDRLGDAGRAGQDAAKARKTAPVQPGSPDN